ncbi:MAG: hypothetical protein ABI700_28150 [Chloroflexota bacterium]
MTLLLVALMLVARLIGTTRPQSALAAVFSNPDGTPCGQPCVFGIRPGETTVADARLLIQAHPLAQNAEWLTDNVLKLAGPDTYLLFSQTDEGLVESISLTATRGDTGAAAPKGSLMDSIMLGDYALVYDITEVNLPGSQYVVFLSPDDGTFASIARADDFSKRIEATTPLAHIIISAPIPCYPKPLTIAGGAWSGFLTIAHYFAQSTLSPTLISRLSMPPTRPCQM